ncbi:hypothetical protein GP475_08650 [Corynebacterium poyangense]|uniref:Uncharacterized protein n=1 Tax=Corynebacterium poyangense TaxID=2684405 RepID=A0A7H0SQ72_9CORY|nr:hypothetical protein [Corynebacterium poyangense]MBZ8178363.1 hypothetical protein [Corynebacterium poyangense]QNQ90697.1 hypothetical protein GP475_08650 [Corynebacterium poyangense]
MKMHTGKGSLPFDEHVRLFMEQWDMSREEAEDYTDIMCGLAFLEATDRKEQYKDAKQPEYFWG